MTTLTCRRGWIFGTSLVLLATLLPHAAHAAVYTENFDLSSTAASNDGDNFGPNYPGWTYHENVSGGTSATVTGGAMNVTSAAGTTYAVLTASAISGNSTFDVTSGPVTVSASATGNNGTAGLYNIGVIVGQVVAVFHPGYTDVPGAGRMETITGTQIVGNQDIGFVPAQGTAYTTSISVKTDPNNSNNYLLDFSVGTYTYSVAHSNTGVSVAKSIVGSLDQVGVRVLGGAAPATFDHLVVTYSPVPEPASLSVLAAAGLMLIPRRKPNRNALLAKS